MRKILFCFYCLSVLLSFSQGRSSQWATQYNTSASSYGLSVTSDSQGNVYTTGCFYGTVDFDPSSSTNNITAAGNSDIFITKQNENGSLVWVKVFGGLESECAYSIKVDDSGNVFTAGSFYGTCDFDPGTGVQNLNGVGGSDVFISKLDNQGEFVWIKQLGGVGSDVCYGLSFDTNGNILTTGNFSQTVDFDPGISIVNLTSSGVDSFISKLDSNGDFIFAKQFNGTNQTPWSIKVDNTGNIYTTGFFTETVDFDPNSSVHTLTAVGNYDAFISKLDPNGNYVWAKQLGATPDNIESYSIAIDDQGNVYTTGVFSGIADFDPGMATFNLTSLNSYQEAFISKLDANGNFVWAKQFGGMGHDMGMSLVLDENDNIFSVGTFELSADFDPGVGDKILTSAGNADGYISMLDSDGNFIWIKQLKGSGTQTVYSISIDEPGNLYVSGDFAEAVDFDPGSDTNNLLSSSYSAYTTKLSPCITSFIDEHTACGNFKWVDGVNYTSSNSTATYTFIDGATNGCDSLVILNLTFIGPVINSAVSIDGITLTSLQSNASYQWINCESNQNVIGANQQSFTPTTNGIYAVEITIDNCTITSECNVVNSVGIDENNTIEIIVFPNPGDGIYSISSASPINIQTIEVLNILGQVICKGNNTTIDLSEQPSGIFYLRINDKFTMKLVKSN